MRVELAVEEYKSLVEIESREFNVERMERELTRSANTNGI